MFNVSDDFDLDDSFFEDVFKTDGSKRSQLDVQKNENESIVFERDSDPRAATSSNSLFNFEKGPPRSGGLIKPIPVRPSFLNSNCGLGGSPADGSPKIIRERKFPGPAGLLPERTTNTSLIATDEFLKELEDDHSNHEDFQTEVLSQITGSIFESEPWLSLLKDLGPEGRNLMERCNVKNLKKHMRATKIPFLAVVLQTLDCSAPDPCLTLRDSTGEINGALHREVWNKFAELILPGCILVLRNVSAIAAGITSKRHFLNITGNNLVTVYTSQKDDRIEVTRVNALDIKAADSSIRSWEESLLNPPSSPVPSGAATPASLFCAMSPVPPSHVPNRLGSGSPAFRKLPGPLRPLISRNLPQPSMAGSRAPFRPPFNQTCPIKKPRVSTPSNQPSIFVLSRPGEGSSEAAVQGLFDGIDTDSLFGDF